MNNHTIQDLVENSWVISTVQEDSRWILLEKRSDHFNRKCLTRVCLTCSFQNDHKRRILQHVNKNHVVNTQQQLIDSVIKHKGYILLK